MTTQFEDKRDGFWGICITKKIFLKHWTPLVVRGQWNHVRKLEAVEYFLYNGYGIFWNYSRFFLPFSPAEVQGASRTALARSSITAPCHSMNSLLVRALTETIHLASRLWEAVTKTASFQLPFHFNCHFNLPVVKNKGVQASLVFSTVSLNSFTQLCPATISHPKNKPSWF